MIAGMLLLGLMLGVVSLCRGRDVWAMTGGVGRTFGAGGGIGVDLLSRRVQRD